MSGRGFQRSIRFTNVKRVKKIDDSAGGGGGYTDKKYIVAFSLCVLSPGQTLLLLLLFLLLSAPPEFFQRALQFAKRLRHTRYAFPTTRIPPCSSLRLSSLLLLLLLSLGAFSLCTPCTTFAPTPLIPKLISRYGINNDIVGKREWNSNPELTLTLRRW